MPASVDEFAIEASLRPDTTWLARRVTGERVVLKRLPADCMRQGKLHPAVRLRLARLRELPLKSFVNLLGVEHVNGAAVLVSEYADGTPFSDLSDQQQHLLLPKLEQIVQELHRLGLVHGNIHGRNLIVGGDDALCLIDPSPLLHDDPAVDLAAIRAMVKHESTHSDPSAIEPLGSLRRGSLAGAIAFSVVGIVIAAVAVFFTRNP